MSKQKGDDEMRAADMETVKPIRPMNVHFADEKEEMEFSRWAKSSEKSTSETAKRVRADFKAYREMKRKKQ